MTSLLFSKETPKGLLELNLESYCGDWGIAVYLAGDRKALNDPYWLTDSDRRRRKLPPDAAMAIGFAVFREPEASAIVRAYEKAVADAEASRLAGAAILEPIGYLYEVGCDRGDTYQVLYPKDSDDELWEAVDERLGTNAIKKNLHAKDFRRIAEETGAEEVPVNLGIYWGCRFSRAGFDQLLSLATERQAEKDAAKTAKTAAREADRAAKVARARETGQPVTLESWTEECDGSAVECSTDVIYRYVHPDGTITTKRVHTH